MSGSPAGPVLLNLLVSHLSEEEEEEEISAGGGNAAIELTAAWSTYKGYVLAGLLGVSALVKVRPASHMPAPCHSGTAHSPGEYSCMLWLCINGSPISS